MVQKSHNSKRQHNLIGVNGETCYALITDHHSGRLYGRAFSSKAPPIAWINDWLANNAPACPNKYVRMDGGGERVISPPIVHSELAEHIGSSRETVSREMARLMREALVERTSRAIILKDPGELSSRISRALQN